MTTLEDQLLLQIRAMQLPEPHREYRFAPKRRWRADFAWPERWVLAEVEGGIYTRGRHVRPQGYNSDCEKYNTAQILGWKVMRFTSQMIEDGTAINTLMEVLA